MRFKVGDRVRIKSLDWYNENKNEYGEVICKESVFVKSMSRYCDSILTIENKTEDCYWVKENVFNWTDEMIEGLVEEETKQKYEDEVNGEYYSTPKYLVRPSGYQFVDENGNVINATKIVLEKKKKEYPKTYEECAKIMNCPIAGPSGWLFDFDVNIKDPYYRKIDILMGKFTRLLICRDAYWKIAGEEMGLGKPWEPDWQNEEDWIHCITTDCGKIYCTGFRGGNKILAFPTEEMRDAFYENFKELIESVKELL